MARILVIDDDGAICTVIGTALRRERHDVRFAGTIAEARRTLDEFKPQVVVTDVMLPDGNMLDHLGERPIEVPMIVLSAQNTLTTAVRANERGAFEYLPKPFDLDELTGAVASALRRAPGLPDLNGEDGGEGLPLIGRSPAMQDIYRIIARVVGNDLTVLILGESGTGKELVARAIHDLGRRRDEPFVAVNMAAIPRELIESELFGHERGAFTGAQARTAGRFEQAQRGTLFLDEIGDMPMDAQTRLLRVLQTGEFTTVGGARAIRTDVRIIAATHKKLPEMVAAGQFREDLYYRLNVVPMTLPPLRQRMEDVGLLARHFLDRAAQEGLPRRRLDGEAVARLMAHDWPGNVRELENLMRRLAALGRDEVISGAQVTQQLTGGAPSETSPFVGGELSDAVDHYLARYFSAHGGGLPEDGLYDRVLGQVEGPLFRIALAATRGNQLRAAQLLGLNRNTLRKKLSDYGIQPGRQRKD
ncbi:MAG: nitrogen regulation protein NR(I) [Sphingomonas sanxanigenens]|uniref:DNA-binding transcriptional regulator NtrC n=1 Tax=Sphingomonas sanxanigenens TaxID=397260 RepID=A0A2W5A4D0_9SPHN|nr:MAG: nitrogen regulation protein NR(I) [Sphingomonas sanxanigenens]